MKKRMKFCALVLAAVMLLSVALTGCQKNPGTTTTAAGGTRGENITLTYATWQEDELVAAMVAKFEDLYPNITVEIVDIDQSSWEQGLFNLATTGDLPDVFWTFDLASATLNEWTMDITELYNADAYTQYVNVDMAQAGMYGDIRYGVAGHQMPYVTFLNKTLFDQANVEMPDYNWTLDDLYSLAKQLTVPREHIYGVSDPTEQFKNMFSYAMSDNLYSVGFDPANQTFDMKYYVQGITMASNWISEGITGALSAEEKEAAYGDAGIWMPDTGKLAMQLDWYWTSSEMKSDERLNLGQEWMIYPTPSNTGRVVTAIDVAAIAQTCEHPEEAYELLKFMTFGAEGWEVRCSWHSFKNKDISALPTTTDEAVWNKIKALNPGEDYAALYDALKNSAPELARCLPGYNAWWGWTFEQDIWGKLASGAVKAEDIEAQMEAKMTALYNEAMHRILSREN